MPVSTALTPLSTPKAREPIYSFSWAADVWWRAAQSHARAWDFLLAASGLHGGHLIRLIACNDPDWAVLREFSHQLDKWAAQSLKARPDYDFWAFCWSSPKQMLSSLLRVKRNLGTESLQRYLTARLNALE